MKQIANTLKSNIFNIKMLSLVALAGFMFSCEDNVLPETNSIEDLTPPSAMFSATESNGDWQTYDFSNQSVSSTTYAWTFGDGNTSTAKEPSNTYAVEGIYTVTLTSSDANGLTSTFSSDVEVVEPLVPVILLPEILEASFEDGMLDGGSGDGRDSWRNSDLGGVIQITSSPTNSGSQAAKFPSGGDRAAYQELEVSPNQDYVLEYWYTMKTSGTGHMTVSVLAGDGFTDPSAAVAATIATYEGTDQSSSNTYVKVEMPFNSGNNTKVSIYMFNAGVESRVDDVSLRLP
jgi:PKD repeat protein